MKNNQWISIGIPIILATLTAFALHFPASERARSDSSDTIAPQKKLTDSTVPASDFLSKQPLRFEETPTTLENSIQFLARSSAGQLNISSEGMNVSFISKPQISSLQQKSKVRRSQRKKMIDSFTMRLKNADSHVTLKGEQELESKSNYFIGKDKSQWRSGISNYQKVRAQSVYPGIDIVYYGTQRAVEFDFEIAPGANPSLIKMEFTGAKHLAIDEKGNLIIQTKTKKILQRKPVIYQRGEKDKSWISGKYAIAKDRSVHFKIENYDASKSLIIDPVIEYSTLFGGEFEEGITAIRTDNDGNIYVLGETQSFDFPIVNAAQSTKHENDPSICARLGGCVDAFISKFDPTGKRLLFSTFLGGNAIENAYGIVVDFKGAIYVTGRTYSMNFPTTPGCFQADRKGIDFVASDTFITKLSANGSILLYSTYLGGAYEEHSYNIAVDAQENAYITGWTDSEDFPVRRPIRAYAANYNGREGFVTKLNSTGTDLIYSTYIGGYYDDECYDIVVDDEGQAYITGQTLSDDFFTTPGAYQRGISLSNDAFVCKIKADGSGFVFSTLVGGKGGDIATALKIDKQKNIYVVGNSYIFGGEFNFPLVNPIQRESKVFSGVEAAVDVFVFKLNATGSTLLYSTYLGGGDGNDTSNGTFSIDDSGRIYLTGSTDSREFPITPNALQPTYGGGFYDAFVSVIDPSKSGWKALVYSSYLGGSGEDLGQSAVLDPQGNFYAAGITRLLNPPNTFPLLNATQSEFRGLSDTFITKISLTGKLGSDVIAPSPTINTPTANSEYSTTVSRLELTGTANDNVGVTQITWRNESQNADINQGISWGLAEGTINWKVNEIVLSKGINRILVTARDAAGNSSEAVLVVRYQPEFLINTVAGGGDYSPEDGLIPQDASFKTPSSVALSPTGEIYFAETFSSSRIWKISNDGKLVKVAGVTGPKTFTDGIPALQATLNTPNFLIFDKTGNLFFSDGGNGLIRKIDTHGIITTVAGDNKFGSCDINGDGGPAVSAHFCGISGLTMNSLGELFITDENRIRKVDRNGIVTTIAGTGTSGITPDGQLAKGANLTSPYSLLFDRNENLYFSEQGRVRKISREGFLSTVAGGGSLTPQDGLPATAVNLGGPGGFAIDQAGRLLMVTVGVVIRVSLDNKIEIIAGNGEYGFSGDGGAATAARITDADSLIVDPQGKIYFSDLRSFRIRVLTPYIPENNFAPSILITSPTTAASYSNRLPYLELSGTASDKSGVIQVSWSNNQGGGGIAIGTSRWTIPSVPVKEGLNNITVTALNASDKSAASTLAVTHERDRIAPVVVITSPTSASNYTAGDAFINVAGTASDDVAVTRMWWRDTLGKTGFIDGSASWQIQNYAAPTGNSVLTVFAEDAEGNISTDTIAISYQSEFLIYTIAGPGLGITNTGTGGDNGAAERAIIVNPSAVALDPNGNIYVNEPIINRIRKISLDGIIRLFAGGEFGNTGDGGPALQAKFYDPQSIFADEKGNVYISDTNNHRIRVVSPTGIITTVAGTGNLGYSNDGGLAKEANLFLPHGVFVDKEGNLLIADTNNSRVRKVSPTGNISTLVGSTSAGNSGDGGDAKQARIGGPVALTMDSSGNLFVVDGWYHCVRKITPAGIISTVAGKGSPPGFSGDGGLAINAQLNTPSGVAADSNGNIFISDTMNHRIRRVDRNGIITTVAGTGIAEVISGGWNGDGIPARQAKLNFPGGIAIDKFDNLYIADLANNRIRKLSKTAPVAAVASVPATNYQGSILAPESLASAFGQELAPGVDVANSLPLPSMLLGTRVWVRDIDGVERPAPLLFVSPTQVNYQVPKETKAGMAQVIIGNAQGRMAFGNISVQAVSAGIFSASSDGIGPVAASLLRVKSNGVRSYEPTYRYDAQQKKFVTTPIDLSQPDEEFYVELYGSGFRNRSQAGNITVKAGGIPVEVLYAGQQGYFIGVDQINLHLPKALKGSGEVALDITIDGKQMK